MAYLKELREKTRGGILSIGLLVGMLSIFTAAKGGNYLFVTIFLFIISVLLIYIVKKIEKDFAQDQKEIIEISSYMDIVHMNSKGKIKKKGTVNDN